MVVEPITSMNDLYYQLHNYGEAYFTDVTISGNDITCFKGTDIPLYLKSSGDSGCVLSGMDSLIFGARFTDNSNAKVLITQVIRTQHGMVIYGRDNWSSSATLMPVFIITKDNAGTPNTVIFAHMFPDSTNGKKTFQCMNSESGATSNDCLDTTDVSLLTSIVPVIVSGSMNFCPNLMWTIQKQYNLTGEIVIGTHHYWTDGQIALLDT